MRRVDFDDVEPGVQRAKRRGAKRGDDRADVLRRQQARHGIVRRERLVRRRHCFPSAVLAPDLTRRFPWTSGARLPSRVRELNTGQRLLRVNEPDDACEAGDVSLVVDAEILRADPSRSRHRGRLGEHERRAAHGAAAQMHEVPVGREAVHARVLTHGRDDESILERQRAQDQRIEQVRHTLNATTNHENTKVRNARTIV